VPIGFDPYYVFFLEYFEIAAHLVVCAVGDADKISHVSRLDFGKGKEYFLSAGRCDDLL